MKRFHLILAAVLLCISIGTIASAQMGMDFFKKPAIASLLKPVVGNGGVYETTREGQAGAPKSTMEWLVVGKELADGKDGFWLEIGMQMKGFDATVYSKALISKEDFQVHRTIMQLPGHPAMEMKVNPTSQDVQRRQDELSQWSQIGTETITVPAGTFVCQHWKKNDGKGDVWANDQISPFGMVKEVNPSSSMVLVKVITDAKDHITGPVTPFDPQAFRQMMMDQMSRQKPN
jgi:hypothetical protein